MEACDETGSNKTIKIQQNITSIKNTERQRKRNEVTNLQQPVVEDRRLGKEKGHVKS